MNKKFRNNYITWGSLAAINGGLWGVLSAASTALIQSIGYRAAMSTISGFGISSLVCGGVLVGVGGLHAYSVLKKKKQNAETEAQVEALRKETLLAERQKNAKLSVAGKLEDKVIYERLRECLGEAWGLTGNPHVTTHINTLLDQLQTMNSYQDKLYRLITSNGTDFLNDTHDVLENAEQDMLRKVRKVLNWFVAYEPTKPDDINRVEGLLEEIVTANETQLENVKEFLLAITDFLNQQGETDTGTDKLQMYKDTILNAISETN